VRPLATVLILALAMSGARADDRDDAREAARAEFTAGQAADQRREWQTAIEHYLRAYDLAPHPFALHNIGADYEQLGQLREAVRFYERYLRDAPDPADRARVERLVAALRTRPSKLTVRSSPPGARVKVDGELVGVTPYAGVVPGGAHRVAVESDADRQAKDITAEFAEPLALAFELRGADGTLVVTGTPVGATVLVDGNPAGRLPAALTVPSGTHRVRVSSDGYEPYEATVEVEPNRPAKLDAELRSAPPKKPPIGYSVNALGGVDLRASDPLFGVEVGLRNDRYQVAVQLGRLGDATLGGLLVRWSSAGRIAPYVGVGYVYFSDATTKLGYTAEAGLHGDLNQTGRVRFGARLGASVAGRTVDEDGMPGGATKTQTTIPITLSLEVWFPRASGR
jgi:hypothetical protein